MALGWDYNRYFEKAKWEANEFYKSDEWAECRSIFLENKSLVCVACDADISGKIKGQYCCVDHIKPVRAFWNLRLDQDNLQILCNLCNWLKKNDIVSLSDLRERKELYLHNKQIEEAVLEPVKILQHIVPEKIPDKMSIRQKISSDVEFKNMIIENIIKANKNRFFSKIPKNKSYIKNSDRDLIGWMRSQALQILERDDVNLEQYTKGK